MYIKYLVPILYVCSRTSYISSVKLIGRYDRNAFSTSMIASRALSTVNPLNYLHKSNRDNNDNNDMCSVVYNDKVDMYTINDKILQNKKMIYVSPGGLRGFYQLGICNYIKNSICLIINLLTFAIDTIDNVIICHLKSFYSSFL